MKQELILLAMKADGALFNFITWGFAITFFIIVIATIAAVTGLISIKEKYLDKLFDKALIGGIISGIVALFGLYMNSGAEISTIVEPASGWIAYDVKSGQIIQPLAKSVENSTTTIDSVTLGEIDRNVLVGKKLSIIEDHKRFVVANEKATSKFGFLPDNTLKKNNFFNDLETINKVKNYREVTIHRDKNGHWKNPKKRVNAPYEIRMDANQALYHIIVPDETIDNHERSYKIDKNDRNLHFIKSKSTSGQNIFYLVYVDIAVDTFKDEEVSKNYVKFVELKIEPTISHKD